jgi:hypothetical protein
LTGESPRRKRKKKNEKNEKEKMGEQIPSSESLFWSIGLGWLGIESL